MGACAPKPKKTKEPPKIYKGKSAVNVNQEQFVLNQDGKIKDKYKIGVVLGSGAFGEVRACTHKATQVERAVKCIIKDYINEEDKQRFFAEIDVLRKLNHPNILKMYEVYSDDKRYYLVTDKYTGGELFDKIISESYFSEREAAKVMKQLLSAVQYCHNNNIVHRDLKPENLVLQNKNADSPIKVIDFGTSQVYDSSKQMKQKYGTPYYIAPEVIKRNYTEKCDVWSCGVILYILLSGSPPFNGHDDNAIMQNVEKGVYKMEDDIWAMVTQEAKDLIGKMMTKDPKKRISAEEAYNDVWIQKTAPKAKVDEGTSNRMLGQLGKFKAEQKLQQATLTYIVSNLVSLEEKDEMRKVFQDMDANGDGKLSRQELIDGYTKMHGENYPVEQEVDNIMANVDLDHNGFIDYSEFQLATLSTKNILSKNKLKAAFDLFDKDKSGSIDAKEIKALLGVGQQFSDKVWDEIVNEVDDNQDGLISYEEFEAMMTKFVN